MCQNINNHRYHARIFALALTKTMQLQKKSEEINNGRVMHIVKVTITDQLAIRQGRVKFQNTDMDSIGRYSLL